jgi:hypothetical protein
LPPFLLYPPIIWTIWCLPEHIIYIFRAKINPLSNLLELADLPLSSLTVRQPIPLLTRIARDRLQLQLNEFQACPFDPLFYGILSAETGNYTKVAGDRGLFRREIYCQRTAPIFDTKEMKRSPTTRKKYPADFLERIFQFFQAEMEECTQCQD